MQASVKIERSFALTNHIFLKHMNFLNDNYGHIACVNLMAKNKKEEQTITDAFSDHIQNNPLKKVRYEYFDFHNAVKSQNYKKTNVLIEQLQPILETHDIFIEDINDNSVECFQAGPLF